jgi:anti-sigma factor (TIGR02949 family)
VLAKLYEYLDSEIGLDEKKHLDQHLEFCPDCLKKYQLEEQFNRVVTEKLQNKPDIAALKARIKQQIDKIDTDTQPRSIFFFLAPLLLAIATVIFVVFPSGVRSDSQAVLMVVSSFASEHSKSLQNLTSFAVQSDDPTVVRSGISQLADLPESLFRFSSRDVAIRGAAVSHLPQGDVPMVDYAAYGANVTLFVLDHNQLDKTPFHKVERNGRTFYTGSCPHYQYVIWDLAGRECVAVSTLPADNLIDFSLLF